MLILMSIQLSKHEEYFWMASVKVLHTRLIYKLKSVGVSVDLLKLINNFLNNRFQQVLLNGHASHWLPVKA